MKKILFVLSIFMLIVYVVSMLLYGPDNVNPEQGSVDAFITWITDISDVAYDAYSETRIAMNTFVESLTISQEAFNNIFSGSDKPILVELLNLLKGFIMPIIACLRFVFTIIVDTVALIINIFKVFTIYYHPSE